MDEIFGEDSSKGTIVWDKVCANRPSYKIHNFHEYILTYCKGTAKRFPLKRVRKGLSFVLSYAQKLFNMKTEHTEAEKKFRIFLKELLASEKIERAILEYRHLHPLTFRPFRNCLLYTSPSPRD